MHMLSSHFIHNYPLYAALLDTPGKSIRFLDANGYCHEATRVSSAPITSPEIIDINFIFQIKSVET